MTEDSPDQVAATAPLAPGDGPSLERPLARGTVLGHFTILERLGAGGMGVVFAAYDYHLERKVAIKLIKPGAGGAAPGRLMREAQAMARLGHVNVRTVYEVGLLDDQVFIAMELVSGSDLGKWLVAAPRTPRAIVEVFLQAGRGLAAAHRAGIIHRDFKPENVLVDDEGRARVTDFGVAKLAAEQAGAEAGVPTPGRAEELTAAGAFPGTPRYMAPEQRAGETVDARADQYAFALALRESLGGRMPAWVRAALAPALDEDPARRYASMEALLGRLGRGPVWRRRALMAAGVAAVAAAALALPLRSSARPCPPAQGRLAGVWDDGVRAAVKKAFLGTGRGYAEPIFRQVGAALDRYAADWAAMHTDACEATAVRREQSTALLDLRMACLDRRRQAMGALTALLAGESDAALLDRAPSAALGLASLADCADAAALTAAYPPPAPPMAGKVAGLRARLDDGQALLAAGRWKAGDVLIRAAVAEAQGVDYPPVRAELLSLLGNLEKESAPAEAEATLEAALAAAAAAHDDRLSARTLVDLLYLLGIKLHRVDEARGLRAIAEAAIVRAGDPAVLRAMLLFNLAMVETAATHYGDAVRLHEEALALRERALGPEHPDVARSLNGLGNVYLRTGPPAKARECYERSIAIWSKLLSPDHPFIANTLTNLADVAEQEGNGAEALEHAQRALTIYEASLGPDHPNVASALLNMGDALEMLGRTAGAVTAQRRALAIRGKVFGADSLEAAAAMNILAGTLTTLGRRDDALAMAERSLAIREAKLGPDHADLTWTLATVADLRIDRGEPALALPLLQRAEAIRVKAFGDGNPQTADIRTALAEAELLLGDATQAAELAARAAAVLEKAGKPADPTRARFVLARALWAVGREKPRALSLAAGCREAYEGAKRGADAERVARWIASRR